MNPENLDAFLSEIELADKLRSIATDVLMAGRQISPSPEFASDWSYRQLVSHPLRSTLSSVERSEIMNAIDAAFAKGFFEWDEDERDAFKASDAVSVESPPTRYTTVENLEVLIASVFTAPTDGSLARAEVLATRARHMVSLELTDRRYPDEEKRKLEIEAEPIILKYRNEIVSGEDLE